jgi:hypothetical protein
VAGNEEKPIQAILTPSDLFPLLVFVAWGSRIGPPQCSGFFAAKKREVAA